MAKKLLTAIIAATAVSAFTYASVSAADFTWKIAENSGQFEPFDYKSRDYSLDADPGTYYDGKNLYLLYTSPNTNWKRYMGTGMDDLKEIEESKLIGFDCPHGDDKYWLCGLYVDEKTGIWYTTVHVEFNYSDGNVHERHIRYATSADKGATWTLGDTIISGDTPEFASEHPGRYESFGNADQKMYVDEASGYFYVYYMKSWIDKETNYMWKTWQVARSPISEGMKPGTWQKWYKGEWSEPGIGGHDSPLFSPPCTGVLVFYSTYLERYVAIGMQKDGNDGFISTCTDLNIQNWETPQKFMDRSRMGTYSWAMDSETWSRTRIGKDFRYYTSYGDAAPMKYTDVSLGKGETTADMAEYFYPNYQTIKESVNDYNDIIDFVPDYAYREDFAHGTDSWKPALGSGSFAVERQQNAMAIKDDDALSPVVFAPEDAPVQGDGIVKYTVLLDGAKQFGHAFGIADDGSYQMVSYKDKCFILTNRDGSTEKLFKFELAEDSNRAYTIEVITKGERLTVKIDDNVKYDEKISGFKADEGRIGLVGFPGDGMLYDDFAYYDGICVKIDGTPIGFDVRPRIENDSTIVPMRKIFELFGAEVSYDDDTKTVTAVKPGMTMSITVGSDTAILNGREVNAGTAPVIQNDRVLVPLRFVSEALGAKVDWDGESETVDIVSNGKLRIGLPKIEPMQLAEFHDLSAIGYIDKMDDPTLPCVIEGNTYSKPDNRTQFDVTLRLYNTEAGASFSRTYELKTEINTLSIGVYQRGGSPDGAKVYVSSDGESWSEPIMSTVSRTEDPNQANMYFTVLANAAPIDAAMRYVRVTVTTDEYNYSTQLYKVAINEAAVEEYLQTDGFDGFVDTLNSFSKTESVKGEFLEEADKRSDYGISKRIYKSRALDENYLQYVFEAPVTTVSAIVYVKGRNPEDYFDICLSEDGSSWDKAELTTEFIERDTVNDKMYFSKISANAEESGDYKHVKIVLKSFNENWAGQLARVEIQ